MPGLGATALGIDQHGIWPQRLACLPDGFLNAVCKKRFQSHSPQNSRYVTTPRETIRFSGGISLCDNTVKLGVILSSSWRVKKRAPELASSTAGEFGGSQHFF